MHTCNQLANVLSLIFHLGTGLNSSLAGIPKKKLLLHMFITEFKVHKYTEKFGIFNYSRDHSTSVKSTSGGGSS